ncbi:MAG: ubiquinol-cytochrome c reductase iron-sulfur subunit [Chloroflexota bacterium]|nr:ubiquinol-cytochrome c reductase iron-sulfur subunit [Chloroflexota bacterium]
MMLKNRPVQAERTRGRRRLMRWQAEFPYHWDADDQVSRRELLRFTVMASGALFAATAGIAALSYLKPLHSVRKQAIAQATDLPPGGVHYFQYPTSEDEAILLHLPDGRFVAYSGRCTHLSCAVYYEQKGGKLLCPCHEGVFDPQTGEPIAGPPQRALPKITLSQEGTTVYAIEEVP